MKSATAVRRGAKFANVVGPTADLVSSKRAAARSLGQFLARTSAGDVALSYAPSSPALQARTKLVTLALRMAAASGRNGIGNGLVMPPG